MAVIQKFSNSELQQEKEKERAMREKKRNSEKTYYFQEFIFSFQTESRAKYTKLQVVLKQVYVGEVYKNMSVTKEALQNKLKIYCGMSYQCE